MSLDLNVYTTSLNDNLIPQIQKRLNEFDMKCEIDPAFSFNSQEGFLPFKFELLNPKFEILRGKVLAGGFEMYIDDFDFHREKSKVQPKPGFMDKLMGKKQAEVPLVNEDIDKRLKDCKKIVTFVWHAGDTFDLRFAMLTGAILTELTNGVCCYPADDIWYENENFVQKTFQEVKQEYEDHLKEADLKFREFEGWK